VREHGSVPWCTACDRFLSPSTVRVDGTCPSCGRVVEPGRARQSLVTTAPVAPGTLPDAASDDEELPPLPWHFKALVGAFAVYLGYRALQGIEWIARQF